MNTKSKKVISVIICLAALIAVFIITARQKAKTANEITLSQLNQCLPPKEKADAIYNRIGLSEKDLIIVTNTPAEGQLRISVLTQKDTEKFSPLRPETFDYALSDTRVFEQSDILSDKNEIYSLSCGKGTEEVYTFGFIINPDESEYTLRGITTPIETVYEADGKQICFWCIREKEGGKPITA